MKDVLFEIEGDPKAFNDGIERELMCAGTYLHGNGENTIVHLLYYYIDDDGCEAQTNIDIRVTYPLYKALKKAFEEDAFTEPGYETTFEIREPVD